MAIRYSPASTKKSADITEEEYERKYDEKKKNGIIVQLSYFITKNARHVLVDVVFLLLRELYFRVVPSFPQLRYDEEWVLLLFLRHSDHEWFWWVPY